VLRLTTKDVVDPSDAIRCADILEPWILIDREIIVNRRAGMYWVMGRIAGRRTNRSQDQTQASNGWAASTGTH
jgi:hypothetical protein